MNAESVKEYGTVKKREPFIDLARLLAMFAIITGHANGMDALRCPLLSIMAYYSEAYVVYFFFFLSGFFCKPSDSWFNIKRAWFIFVPLVIYCAAGTLLAEFMRCCALQSISAFDVSCLLSAIGNALDGHTVGNPYLWFLKVLIIHTFFSPLLWRVEKATVFLIGIALYLASTYLISVQGVSVFIDRITLESGCFFALGVAVGRCVTLDEFSQFFDKYAIPIALVLVGLYTLTQFCGKLTYFCGKLTYWPSMPFLGKVLVCFYFLSLAKVGWKLLPRVVEYLGGYGKYTFFIYAIQWYVLSICETVFTAHPIDRHWYGLIPFGITFGGMYVAHFIYVYSNWLSPYLLLLPARRRTQPVNQTN